MAADLLYSLLPEQIMLAVILIMMLLEICRISTRAAAPLVMLAGVCCCAVLLTQLATGYSSEPIADEIRIDRFALLARLAVSGCGLLFGLCFREGSQGYKFWLLFSSSLLGAMVIMDSAGFITFFMGIEILSLPAFAMMTMRSSASSASEGAFKYLLLSSVASALILFGLSLVYAQNGSLAVTELVRTVETGGPAAQGAFLLMLSGFFLKAALFPFHGWAPDAYSSVRLQTTAFLASLVKGSVVLALVRLVGGTALNSDSAMIVSILAVASILYGNLTAIAQTGFRRLLAYSSVAHAGYMVFALTDAGGGRVEALLYYVSVYAVTTIIACACFLRLVDGEQDETTSLRGAFAEKPVPALLLSLAMLSLAGIPPLPGFLAKVFIFKSVIASGHLVAAVLAFVGSYIGVVYYLGIVLHLFQVDTINTTATEPSERAYSLDAMMLWGAFAMLFVAVPGVCQRLLAYL